jgi:hypothetical protein
MKALAVICILLVAASIASPQGYVPKSGFVPDSKTARKIAEAVLVPIYGEAKIQEEQPFTAKLEGDIWIVAGTLRCKDQNGKTLSGEHCMGEVAVVKLAKSDGRILSMTHYK